MNTPTTAWQATPSPLSQTDAGAPPAPPAPPAPEPTPPPAPEPPATPPAPPATPPAPPAGQTFDQWLADPTNAEHTKKLRDEAASHRTKARDAEAQRDAVLAALGITADGTPPDPEKLAADLTATQAELRKLRTTTALQSAAVNHGADLDLIVPFLNGNGALAALDPSAPTFAAELDVIVKGAVDGNPKLKASGQAPGRSGADFAGGTGGEHIFTVAEVSAMSDEDFKKNEKTIQDQMGKGLIK